MIVNTQLAGEATWFWYATLFHRGAKPSAQRELDEMIMRKIATGQ
jgi:hypothetical protein